MRKGITPLYGLVILSVVALMGCPRPPRVPEPDLSSLSGKDKPTDEPLEARTDYTGDGTSRDVYEPYQLNPVFFDYDRSEIREDQIPVLESNAGTLQIDPNVRVQIEGHCDERGTEEYNLALGEHRAGMTREY